MTMKRYLKEADQSQWPPSRLITSLRMKVVLKKAPERIPRRINLTMGSGYQKTEGDTNDFPEPLE